MDKPREQDFYEGAPIGALTDTQYNEIVEEVRKNLDIQAVAPIQRANNYLQLALVEPFPVVLSGVSSPYDWTEQLEDTAGTWVTYPRTGTASAYEVNSVDGLAGKVVKVLADEYDGWRFQWVSSGSGGTSIPCYSCAGIPLTLYLTQASLECLPGSLITLTYSVTQPLSWPSGITSGIPAGWYGSLPAPGGSPPICTLDSYYALHCDNSPDSGGHAREMSLERYLLAAGSTTPVLSTVIESYKFSTSGNSCSPFLFTKNNIGITAAWKVSQ